MGRWLSKNFWKSCWTPGLWNFFGNRVWTHRGVDFQKIFVFNTGVEETFLKILLKGGGCWTQGLWNFFGKSCRLHKNFGWRFTKVFWESCRLSKIFSGILLTCKSFLKIVFGHIGVLNTGAEETFLKILLKGGGVYKSFLEILFGHHKSVTPKKFLYWTPGWRKLL